MKSESFIYWEIHIQTVSGPSSQRNSEVEDEILGLDTKGSQVSHTCHMHTYSSGEINSVTSPAVISNRVLSLKQGLHIVQLWNLSFPEEIFISVSTYKTLINKNARSVAEQHKTALSIITCTFFRETIPG